MNTTLWAVAIVCLGLVAQVRGANPANRATAENERLKLVCHLPEVIETNPRSFFYYKCELTNKKNEPVTILTRTRTYLATENGMEKCLRFDANLTQEIKPGETISWWQHATAPRLGTFPLQVRLEPGEDLKTDKVNVTFVMAPQRTEDEETSHRNQVLQQHWDQFDQVTANTTNSIGKFQTLRITKDPVRISGNLYYGFVFEAPKGDHDLVWAFLGLEYTKYNWFVVPQKGVMKGFTSFIPKTLPDTKPGVGKSGQEIILQTLASDHFEAGSKYLIWFQSELGRIDQLTFSLNFPPEEKSSVEAVFPEFE